MRAVSNPPNPWHSVHGEYLDEAPPAKLEVFEEQARSVVSENDSPDVGFRYSVNPYRGCLHACAYCYARPSHQYLDFGAGTDFDRKIVVKVNAAEALRETFDKRSWQGELLCFSGNTDCYQPLEATYGLTRACLEVCLAYRNPITIITKSRLVQRDAELLAALHREASAMVWVSIAFDDEAHARALEPYAPPLARRYETLEVLARAGVPVGLALAPLIPGLNDSAVPAILARAREAGATRMFSGLLRLAAEVRPVFEERLREALPLRADKVLHGLRDQRGGRSLAGAYGARMQGVGPQWDALSQLVALQSKRLGYDDRGPERPRTFRRPTRQGSLFGD